MARRFKVGDKIRLKPHTELGLTEYTWGTIIVEDIDPNTEYPYRVKIMTTPSDVSIDSLWSKESDGYSSWVARNEYVDSQFTKNKSK
jgi:hypothetical protein